MGDRELSTRDLAERSDTTASDAPVEPEQEASDQEPSRSGGAPGETEPPDEPMTRGPRAVRERRPRRRRGLRRARNGLCTGLAPAFAC